ncbi:MAG: hypothetical protein LUI06_08800 [Ruminococcus sp.]|nr:hypothetical protein [Ruminococcus sp.]
MLKLKKSIISLGASVVMIANITSLSANAFSATYYKKATGGSITNAYVSCYVTGSRTSNTVSGTAWTKTSSNNSNVYNPNVAYKGSTSVVVTVGGVSCGSKTTSTGSATKTFSLSGCTSSKTVKTTHIFDSDEYGSCSKALSVSSD